jgi:uncharacterized Zn finger protein
MPKLPAKSIETSAGPHRFDVDTLRDVAGQKSFARGVAYHEDGSVEIITFDSARVTARVVGSEVYRCELVGVGKSFSGHCTCRAFEDWGFCKHLVATSLTANALGPEALEQAANRFAKIREHLRAKGIDNLVEMVVGLAECDPSLLQELELSATAATADDKTLFAQFRKAITDATRTRGYVEYGEMGEWVQGIETVLDRLASLIEIGRAALVLRLLDHFFARMHEAFGSMDDSDGGAGGVYANACEVHLAACCEAKPDPVALARELFTREVESEWDFFRNASAIYENVLGDAGLAEYRRLANEAWKKIKPRQATGRRVEDDQAGARFALTSILERFAERDGDVDGIIAIRARDLSTAYRYLGIAQFCLDQGRDSEALKWTEDGLWQFEDNPDERLISFASDLYRRIGRKEDADKLLWRMFERRPSIELYERLKSTAGTDRMLTDVVRARAFALLRSQLGKPRGWTVGQWSAPAEILARLMMADGLLAETWIIVNGYGCSETLRSELAEASEQSHPAEALKVYTDRVEQMVRLGGQSNYEDACRLIGRMRSVREGLGENAQHLAFLYDLMSRHKAKRNFIKLLTASKR